MAARDLLGQHGSKPEAAQRLCGRVRILVTGASGVLGAPTATVLEQRGHAVMRASRRPRAGWAALDLRDPASVERAAAAMDAVVHCAADPFGKPRQVEVGVWRTLRKVAPDARFVYPSIVGCDQVAFPYYKVKSAGEAALAAAGGDHAILRLTQFHEFADRLARLPVPLVPLGMRAQTIAAAEAAAALADVVQSDRQGLVGDVGGPEVHVMSDLVKQRLRADGRRRPIMRVPLGTRGFRAGRNLCPEAKVGKVTWQEHLEATASRVVA